MRAALAVLLATVGGYGAFLLYTALALGWRGLTVAPRAVSDRRRRPLAAWARRAGLPASRERETLSSSVVLLGVGGALGWAVFGGAVPALAAGLLAATFPVAAARRGRERRREQAREAWPRLIEEIRLQTVSLGRSIPQALFTVGQRAPSELAPAFAAAQREWLISTDFDRSLDVLKARLADPTADAVCETLLVAHQVGGTQVDERLRALTDDRVADLQGRKDARAKQAGARFARRFVLVVPLGMALVGLSIGNGRAAYQTAAGQLAVLAALVVLSLTWWWSGRLLRLPGEERVFGERGPAGGEGGP